MSAFCHQRYKCIIINIILQDKTANRIHTVGQQEFNVFRYIGNHRAGCQRFETRLTDDFQSDIESTAAFISANFCYKDRNKQKKQQFNRRIVRDLLMELIATFFRLALQKYFEMKKLLIIYSVVSTPKMKKVQKYQTFIN